MIYVTQTFLPPQDEYQAQLDRIWETKWLTNRGKLTLELEEKIKDTLGCTDLLLLANGTIAIQIAIKALKLKGEIITTPFSYVATVSSIVWEHCTPVFVDIDPETLCIDSSKIEEKITENTTGILATHVFGNMCDVDTIDTLAKKHDLKVVYDAAHCFGVEYKGVSAFNYGDIATTSMHATKLFHTGEGGAVFCNDASLLKRAFSQHNFGHTGYEAIDQVGINGKISELQAAMGLSVLPYISEIIEKRKKVSELYKKKLQTDKITYQKLSEAIEYNYAYFPVIFESEEALLKVQEDLNEQKIYPRRYFYPSLNTLPYVSYEEMLISESIAKRILCLPLSTYLTEEQIIQITDSVLKSLHT